MSRFDFAKFAACSLGGVAATVAVGHAVGFRLDSVIAGSIVSVAYSAWLSR